MMDAWLAGAYRDPGFNAGYTNGRNLMRRAVAHFTVGRDSRQGGRDGFYNFLVHRDVSREGGCTQYAEVDALTWHAGNAGNPYGPGIEFERMVTGGYAEGLAIAEPLTQNQIDWGIRIIAFYAEWGIQAVLYDGLRFDYGDWRGWINHHDIDKDRFDGLTSHEWAAMVTSPVKEDEMHVRVTVPNSGIEDVIDGIWYPVPHGKPDIEMTMDGPRHEAWIKQFWSEPR